MVFLQPTSSTLGITRTSVSFVKNFRQKLSQISNMLWLYHRISRLAYPYWSVAFQSRASSLRVGLSDRLPVLRFEDGGVGTSTGLFVKERENWLAVLVLPSSDILSSDFRVLLFPQSVWSKPVTSNLRFRFAATLVLLHRWMSALSSWSIVST
jgi:hypothetical protein